MVHVGNGRLTEDTLRQLGGAGGGDRLTGGWHGNSGGGGDQGRVGVVHLKGVGCVHGYWLGRLRAWKQEERED